MSARIKSLRASLEEVLKEMERSDPEIEASALVRTDGLIMASALPEDVDKTLVAAMTAAVMNIGSRALEELKRGTLQEVLVRGDQGIICVMRATKDSVLSAIARPDANVGLVLVEMRKAIDKISKFLE